MAEFSFSLVDIENMIPWERVVFLSLLRQHVKKKNEIRQQTMNQLQE